jgi:SpoVK/Ycf46/Vps4 family AAA+-type ATPase
MPKDRDWLRFGSPYDPNYIGGKRAIYEGAKEPPRPRQLRGCGDPLCSMCNPATADAIRRGEMRPDYFKQPARAFSWEAADYSVAPTSSPTPLASREAVERWLIKAPPQAFEDIIGNDEALAQLRDAIEAPKKYAKLYAAYGMKMPKGVLLSGPPGCGKTMFARAAASEMSRLYGMKEFICISGSELQSMFVGQTEAFIKSIFTYARDYAHVNGHPLLVFMDEAEVLLPDRTGRVRRLASWEESQVATFLAEMDGIQESGAFVMLATNRPEVIDQAILRDGRCDFKIVVKRPTQAVVETIIRKSFANAPVADDLETLVFTAVESFYDPHKIIFDFHSMVEQLRDWFTSRGLIVEDEKDKQRLAVLSDRNFSFEHIISGAMATSVVLRAKRYAFGRDKEHGTITGIKTEDVIRAVNDIFTENKSLEHSFAIMEFAEQLHADLEAVK